MGIHTKDKRQTWKWRNVSCFVQSATTRDFFRIWNMDVGWASCTPHKDWFFWTMHSEACSSQKFVQPHVTICIIFRFWWFVVIDPYDHHIIQCYPSSCIPVSCSHVHSCCSRVRTVIHAIVKCGGYQHNFGDHCWKSQQLYLQRITSLFAFETVFGIHQIKTKPPMCSSSTAALPAKIRYLQLFGNVKSFLGCCFTGQFTSPQLVEPHLRFTYFQGDI